VKTLTGKPGELMAEVIRLLQSLKDDKVYELVVREKTKRRSLDANALLWECIGKVASANRVDKWDVYLDYLRRFGRYTYIEVPEPALDYLKRQWREVEVIGETEEREWTLKDGRRTRCKSVQALCYVGSSKYSTKEFGALLDGVIADMEQMDIEPPTSGEMRRALELWEKRHGPASQGT